MGNDGRIKELKKEESEEERKSIKISKEVHALIFAQAKKSETVSQYLLKLLLKEGAKK